MKNLIFVIIIFSVSNFSLTYSQSQYGFECGFTDSSGSLNSSIFNNSFTGLNKPVRTDISGDSASPSTAYFPIIVVFVQFKDDADDWQWPTNQPPIYLDSVIAGDKSYNADWWDAYNENTEAISDYWLESSRGKFHVTGKAFSVVLSKLASEYSSDSEINLEIWRNLRTQGLTNWQPYDKWRDTIINNEVKFYYQPDGYVDMIYKIHKNYDGPLWDKRGYAHLTTSQYDFSSVLVDTANNVKVGYGYRGKGSGLTVSMTPRKNINYMVTQHEHGHFLYANGHITYGKVSYGPGGDGYFSPYEMILLRYQEADTVNFSSQTNYYLTDYSARNSSNGEILRVPISGQECFLIANRGNASKWDKPMLGDTTQIKGAFDYTGNYGRGIYIYHVNSSGIIFPNGLNIHPQDEECADGVWYWSNKGEAQRYAWDAGYCFNAGMWDYYLRDSVSYSNDGGWNSSPADARSFTSSVWAGVGKINTSDPCLAGIDRTFTNSNDIYANEEVLGDRYDAWNIGYNEVFNPYSSPNTKSMGNDSTGIFIWLYSNSGSGPQNSAALKIFKTGQGGFSRDSILHLTPPSRPMGIVVDYYQQTENIMRPIITWNHNKEPDMLRTDLKKRYKIWRATHTTMNSVPTAYTLLTTCDVDSGTAPSYIDTSVIAQGSGWPGMGPMVEYPVRYKVQAIDKYQDSSVRSDFGSIIGIYNCSICEDGPDNIILDPSLPTEYSLYQNYPNPFNPETSIKFDLPQDNFVTIKVYDILGKEIYTLLNDFRNAGRYSINFNGSNFASGIYYYKIKAEEFESIKKMILIK